MKKMMLLLSLITFLIVGCDNPDEVRGASWGMSKEDVISIEEENGNVLHEEDEGREIILNYEDVKIDGVNMDIKYVFDEQIDVLRHYPPQLYDDGIVMEYYELLNNNEGNKLSELDDEVLESYEEYNDLPSIFTLSNYMLTYIIYNYSDITVMEKEKLLDSLVDKYGDPDSHSSNRNDDFDSYYWYTDETMIHFLPNYIHFYGTYHSLEEWVTGGKYYDTITIP